jgi:LysM repeat protein
MSQLRLVLPKWAVCQKRHLRPLLLAATTVLLALGFLGVPAVPASAGTIRVTKGATLYWLAARLHTTVAALAAANGITNPNLLFAGAVLKVPTSGSGSGSPGSVTVGRGEDLTVVARRYGVSVAALAAANDITNLNLIYAGEVLELPGSGSAGGSQSNSTVTVGIGDTLTSIARRYGTTVSALAATNAIANPNSIFAGEHLTLPSSGMALASYSVPSSGAGLPSQLLSHPTRLSLRPGFVSAAATYGVPASLLEALCWWESGWQTNVVSVTGAFGVCQIEPATASFVNQVLHPRGALDVHSASGNISIAALYLHYLLARTGGDESLAIAAYYQGLHSVETQGMLPTTHSYVAGILAYASVFAAAG